MKRKEESTGLAKAAPLHKEITPTSSMVVEGSEAIDLHARQIAFNLNELEKQVEMLRAACVRTGKLLREVE